MIQSPKMRLAQSIQVPDSKSQSGEDELTRRRKRGGPSNSEVTNIHFGTVRLLLLDSRWLVELGTGAGRNAFLGSAMVWQFQLEIDITWLFFFLYIQPHSRSRAAILMCLVLFQRGKSRFEGPLYVLLILCIIFQ